MQTTSPKSAKQTDPLAEAHKRAINTARDAAIASLTDCAIYARSSNKQDFHKEWELLQSRLGVFLSESWANFR